MSAKSYHPTEVVEGEIARLLADKEKKTMKVLVTGATGF